MRIDRKFAPLILAAAMAATALPAAAQEKVAGLADYKAAFEKNLTQIDEDFAKNNAAIAVEYGKDLAGLAQKFQKAGDLDNWEIVNKELARFTNNTGGAKSPTLSLEETPFKPAADKFFTSAEDNKLARAKQVVSLANRYLAALDTMKKRLTQEGKFDAAREAKDESEAVPKLPVVATAVSLVQSQRKIAPQPARSAATPAPAAQSAQQAIPSPDSLVLHYNCAKKDDKTVADLSGHKRDGEVHGAKWMINGAAGAGYSFDGDGDYIEFDPDHDISRSIGSGDFTLAVWIEAEKSRQPTGYIIEEQTAGPPWIGINIAIEPPNVRFRCSDIGSAASHIYIDSDEIVGDGKVHCIVAMRENGTLKLYLDGKLKDRKKVPPVSLRTKFLGAMRVGAHSDLSREGNFRGTFYQLMIYDTALSDSDIKKLATLRK